MPSGNIDTPSKDSILDNFVMTKQNISNLDIVENDLIASSVREDGNIELVAKFPFEVYLEIVNQLHESRKYDLLPEDYVVDALGSSLSGGLVHNKSQGKLCLGWYHYQVLSQNAAHASHNNVAYTDIHSCLKSKRERDQIGDMINSFVYNAENLLLAQVQVDNPHHDVMRLFVGASWLASLYNKVYGPTVIHGYSSKDKTQPTPYELCLKAGNEEMSVHETEQWWKDCSSTNIVDKVKQLTKPVNREWLDRTILGLWVNNQAELIEGFEDEYTHWKDSWEAQFEIELNLIDRHDNVPMLSL